MGVGWMLYRYFSVSCLLFYVFRLPVLILLYICFVLPSLYSYSLCLDVFYGGIIPTRDCIDHSYACTAAGEMAMLFGHWFPPHSPSMAGYNLAWLCCVQSSSSLCFTKNEYKNRNCTE